MSAGIIDLVDRLSKRVERSAAYKVAKGTGGDRLFHVGMKVPTASGETVELRICSNEPGKRMRNLARVTVGLDDLRRLMRELENEPPFWPQRSLADVDHD